MNLLALCRTDDGIQIKRVPVTNGLQTELNAVFTQLESTFREGRPNEADFNGDWKPEEDELLILNATEEADAMFQAASGNMLALPAIDTANFEDENIRALFTSRNQNGNMRLLVQRFTSHQRLNRSFSVFLNNNHFEKLTEPAFTIGNKLTCIIEGGRIKFDSYSNLRMIFNLTEYFQEATDEDIEDFAAHSSLNLENLDAFKEHANQTVRKLVHKIRFEGILDKHTVSEIQQKAQETGLTLNIVDKKISLPQDPKLIRQFLNFLNDNLYEAPLSGQRYVTNSKRAIN